jgi:hypothetical protein
VGSWSSDETKLAFCLGPPYFEIWTADLDPKTPAIKALGPGQAPDEHFQEMVAFYTRRIEGDPQDAYAYSNRAHYYGCLHDRVKANADMRQFSAILSAGASSDVQVGVPRRLRRAINGPFGYQLAFSVGGRDDGVVVLCVACGQKGRCEMRVFEIPMLAMSLFGLGLLSGLDAPPAYADFTFGEPVNLKTVIPVLDPAHDSIDCFSSDGLEMYIESDRPGGYGDFDIWVARRVATNSDWGPPENLGPIVNSSKFDSLSSISADGLALYFASDRPGGYGSADIWMTTRTARNAPWGPPVNLGPKVNSAGLDTIPAISTDGLELYFVAYNRSGGYGAGDIYVAKRATTNALWGEPANLGPVVNSAYNETSVSLSADGLLLLFSDYDKPRPGGYGSEDMWMARRASLSAPWQTPVNLGPKINSSVRDGGPRISPDGRMLYFLTVRDGIFDNWQAPIIPNCDFNADGKVDLVDLVMLIDDWGKTQSVCDIGPMPWGDSKVDIEDLKVFMTYYEKANPPAQP